MEHLSYNKRYILRMTKSSKVQIFQAEINASSMTPMLFSIYENDLYKCSEKLSHAMFADDTNLFLSSINVDDLFSYMNYELMNLLKYICLKANKLLRNLTKTKYFLFHPDSIEFFFLKEPLPFCKMDKIAIER